MKQMKNLVLIVALVFISSAGISQKVNFSGNWKINKEKSTLGYEFSLAPESMILKHEKNTLDVERHSNWQGEEIVINDHFTLDGKECENPAWRDLVKKSTATWNKKTKVLTITTKVPMAEGGDATIISEYLMNGDNLVVESSASSDYGEIVERFVFDKQ
jgi:hypothetical protein